jgi:hypothetical protein
MPSPKRSLLFRAFGGFASIILYILSIPAVRNALWNKLIAKGSEKVSKMTSDKKVIDVDYEVKK